MTINYLTALMDPFGQLKRILATYGFIGQHSLMKLKVSWIKVVFDMDILNDTVFTDIMTMG